MTGRGRLSSSWRYDTTTMKRSLLILFYLTLAFTATSPAQPLEDPVLLFSEGNHLYERGDYQGAAEKYERIVTLGYESGAVYYNLGNCYFRLKSIGRAILNYERARRLLPDDEAVNFNLDLANLLAVDRIIAPPQFILFKYVTTFKNWLTIDQLCWITLSCYLICMALLILRIFTRRRKLQAFIVAGIVIVALPLVLFAATLVVRAHEARHTIEALVLSAKISVMSEPSPEATEQFYLHEGAKVRIEDSSGQWLRIRLADGKVGWLLASTVEIL